MEATTNCNRNRAIVAERLQIRGEARKEAIRKQEEAHARFERVMIRTVNEQHAGIARKLDNAKAANKAADEAKRKTALEAKRKKALERAAADGEDHMLHIYVCCGAFVFTAILRSFGIMPQAAGIFVRFLLAGYFCYNVYRLYQVSSEVAELSEGGH